MKIQNSTGIPNNEIVWMTMTLNIEDTDVLMFCRFHKGNSLIVENRDGVKYRLDDTWL
jgi:hypothetical protein